MNYQEFINKWNGKFCEMGGSANAVNQCVDLANAYIKEVLGLPIILGTNAIDFPKKCLPPEYEYIKNTPEGIPQQGDIMIYKSADGIGHIDIFDHGDSNNFVAFSQNWPLKSVCKMVDHIYTGKYTVDGWLRCKIKPVSDLDNMTDEQKKIMEFLAQPITIPETGETRVPTEGDVRRGIGYITSNIDKKLSDMEKLAYSSTDKVKDLEVKLAEEHKIAVGWQNALKTARDEIKSLNLQLLSAVSDLTVKQLISLIIKKLKK